MRRTPRKALLGGLTATALIAVGCGSDDFENEPRPPSPIEITAAVTDKKVKVSPASFGAGPVVISISNTSEDDVTLLVDGPTTERSLSIGSGTSGTFKVILDQGDYDVSAADAPKVKSDSLEVGPERATAQNELLLP